MPLLLPHQDGRQANESGGRCRVGRVRPWPGGRHLHRWAVVGVIREMWLCECGQGDPPEHYICSVCGDDWPDCECVSGGREAGQEGATDGVPDEV